MKFDPLSEGDATLSASKPVCDNIPSETVHQQLVRQIADLQRNRAELEAEVGQLRRALEIAQAQPQPAGRTLPEHAALRRRESTLNAMFRAVPMGLGIIVRETITEANDYLAQLLGYEPAELIGRSLRSLHPSTPECKETPLINPDRDEFASTDTQWRCKDGSCLDIRLTLSPVDPADPTQGVAFAVLNLSERKQVESALRLKTEELDRFFEVTLDLLCVADTDGRFLRLNRAWERTLGHTREVLMAGRFLEFVHPEDVGKTLEAMQRLASQREVIDFVNRYRSAEGTYRLLEWRSAPVGRLVYAAARDITERSRVEEALRASETKFSKVFHTSPDAINISRLADGMYLELNSGFTLITGFTEADARGKTSKDIQLWANPEDRDRLVEELRARGAVTNFEALFRMKDGRIRVGLMSSRIIEINDEPCLVSVTRDITELKQAEETLRESEEQFRVAFNDAPTGMSIIGADGFSYLAVNPLLCKMFGYTQEELLGNTISLVTHPDDVERSKEWVRKKYHGEPCECDLEKRFIHKDGHLVWGSVRAQWIRNKDGTPRMALAHILDITARKQAEEEIRRLHQELEQRVVERTAQLETANHDLEAFSYSVSHDLRAPLRHIAGYVRLLQMHAETILDAEGHRLLDTVADASKRMTQLIDDLLAFSRIGRAPLGLAPMNLNQLVADCLHNLAPDVKDRNIEWVIPPLPEVPGDRVLFKQALFNLLSNAVKYTRPRTVARIELGYEAADAEWKFYVRDNGVGFDMQYAGKLFGVFQRLHSVSEFEGTGIGLANVRQVILRHGGRTWAEGETDAGATFYFTLPKPARGTDGSRPLAEV